MCITLSKQYNFFFVCYSLSQRLIDLFIENGAEVNFQNESLKTPLMLAAFYGKISMVKTLRQHGASYSIKDNTGMSAIHYAVDGGHCDTLELMITDGADVVVFF